MGTGPNDRGLSAYHIRRACEAIDYYGPTDISKMNMEPSTWDHMSAKSPEGLFIGRLDVLQNPGQAVLEPGHVESCRCLHSKASVTPLAYAW
jgi:hypothetical protein